jgi:hypothetical protein
LKVVRDRVAKQAWKHVEDLAPISGETSRAVARRAAEAATGAVAQLIDRQQLSNLHKEVKLHKVSSRCFLGGLSMPLLTNHSGEQPPSSPGA